MRLKLLSTLGQVAKTLVLLDLVLLSQPASSASLEQPHSSKLVFAHFITGLTVNYSPSDWSSQINLAASHGIDAFALNVGLPDGWQLQQVKDAYNAADAVKTTTGTSFKLFLSLDMSVIQSADDVTTWVTSFVPLSAQLLINGRPLISTFSGETNKLGGDDLSSGWHAALKAPLARRDPPLDALFIPAWSSLDPTTAVSRNPVVDGIMTWSSWPTGSENIDTLIDNQFQSNARSSRKLYMAGVSPCSFTHYEDKNWIYKSDDNLYINRWMKLISMPDQPDFIQIISWNDYGESHYIGPRLGTPPADTTWLDGFDHQSWLKMSDYFIKWYKTGTRPTIEDDTVHFNYRPHSVNAVATSDALPPPTNASVSVDAVYASTFLSPTSTATQLRIKIGDMQQSFGNLSKSEVSTFTAPWNGHTGKVEVALLDSSGKELMKKLGDVPISNNIMTYNFNYAPAMLSKSSSGTGPPSLPTISLFLSLVIYHGSQYLQC